MARKKKESGQQVREGDIVILYAQVGCQGQVLGSGVVERIKPMHGAPNQDMVWVPGFAAHHPNAVERVGAPGELIGKINLLEQEGSDFEDQVEALKKDLASTKEKLDVAHKALDKTPAFLYIVEGNEYIDAKAAIKWIREVRVKFSLHAIREIGSKPVAAPVAKKEVVSKDEALDKE